MSARHSSAQHDLDLVQRCIALQPEAWTRLLALFETTVRGVIRSTFRMYGRYAGDDLLADLQSELIIRLMGNGFARLRQFEGRCSLNHWLKVVARNLAVDHLRQNRMLLSLEDQAQAEIIGNYPDPSVGPDVWLQYREAAEILDELMRNLSAEDRRFLRLYHERDLGFPSLARAMGTSVGAIYSRKSRIHKKLAGLERRRRIHECLKLSVTTRHHRGRSEPERIRVEAA